MPSFVTRITRNKDRLLSRFGRRGVVLAAYAILFFGQAWAFASLQVSNTAAFAVLTELLPTQTWGAVWLAAGVLCALGAYSRKLQPFGFSAAASVLTLWSLASFFGWIEYMNGAADAPARIGWVGGLVFGAFAVKLMIIAGWRENDGS